MPYTPEELDELASDAAWDGGDIATMMEVFAQAARDARLRQGVERLRDELQDVAREQYELSRHNQSDDAATMITVAIAVTKLHEVNQAIERLRALLAETETP